MKRVGIFQSNYIPWKGYFDLIHDVDLALYFDDVQYTKNDWRNRNKVKTPAGSQWLTIPAGDNINRLICEVTLDDKRWQIKHWKTLSQHYGKAPYFKRYQGFLEHVYLETKWDRLSAVNQYMIRSIAANYLGIKTTFAQSSDIQSEGRRQDRVMHLLKAVGANSYVSGPAGKDYIDPARFHEENIELVWKDYSGYPEYPQFFPPFEHAVSVLDLLFQTGPDAPYFIWGWREEKIQSPLLESQGAA